jgi:hypothetical protein
MAVKIEAWQSKDGQNWKSEREAQQRDEAVEIAQQVEAERDELRDLLQRVQAGAGGLVARAPPVATLTL